MSRKPKFTLSLSDMDKPATNMPQPVFQPSLAMSGPMRPNNLSLAGQNSTGSAASDLKKFIDISGKLNFAGKAVLDSTGVNFQSGVSYKIEMSQLITQEELGRGQFGVVNKVFHTPTNVTMAMKQIKIEISDSAFSQILMELDVLHRSRSPFIIDFYGAFFLESSVYICMEFMDAGSLDKLYGAGISEPVLGNIACAVVSGLRFLKQELQVIHRDVKPTNILLNRKGQIKLCDFGVSGQLVQSMAKTNIGCQSYMAPERIITSSSATYTTSADIWSLGISLWEAAMGRYPFSADQYDSMFAQLNAIIHEDVPELSDKFSPDCCAFVKLCIVKNPASRPTYNELYEHQFIKKFRGNPQIDMAEWACTAYDEWRTRSAKIKQAAADKALAAHISTSAVIKE